MSKILRHEKSIKFLKKHIIEGTKILDLGEINNLSKKMTDEGYIVTNTQGENLDVEYHKYLNTDAELITAFEIFEHMLAPFNFLNDIKSKKMIASVPLNLWFAKSYWNESYEWGRHYHEFEKRQFDLLLIRTGWKVLDSEKWIDPVFKIGIKPFLRLMYPRTYIVYCEKP